MDWVAKLAYPSAVVPKWRLTHPGPKPKSVAPVHQVDCNVDGNGSGLLVFGLSALF